MFGAHSQDDFDANGGMVSGDRHASVIFEYKMPGASSASRVAMAKAWHALADHTIGTVAYNNALATILSPILSMGVNSQQPPNNTYLNQLRTNEQRSDSLWVLAEYHIETSGYLNLVHAELTPDASYQNSDEIAQYINDNEASILAGTHTVPVLSPYTGLPFKQYGFVRNPKAMFWRGSANVAISNNEARHLFSLNTCNGCHGRESDSPFHMIDPNRQANSAPTLADFVTNMDVTVIDPRDSSVQRIFNDIERRAADLDSVLNQPSIFENILNLLSRNGSHTPELSVIPVH